LRKFPPFYFVTILANKDLRKQNFMETTIAAALREATQIFENTRVSEPRRQANLLLGFALDKDLTFLIAHSDEILSDTEWENFFELIERRAAGEPTQYILGKQEFYGLDFEVNENVLIPRPETEFIVEIALEILAKQENKFFCDVGTGSGCIPVAILKNLPEAIGYASDISPSALAVARRNAAKHSVVERLTLLESDVFSGFDNLQSAIRNPQFEVIVSNPPYIPQSDSAMLQREVKDFEPHTALFGGTDGLEIVRRLLTDAPKYLQAKGYLLFEIGFTQSEAVKEMLVETVWQLLEVRADLQGIPRIVVLQKR
jgi:release factor glutamine methyltransferase